MTVIGWFAAMAAVVLGVAPVAAQETRSVVMKPERVAIAYDAPTDPAHRPLFESLRERRALETAQAILAPMRLPKPLLIRTASCEGQVNAWFEGETITICYEYVAWIAEVARKPGRPASVSEEAALAGPFLEVVLHESAHALFDYLEIPILGREEDAADQIAALFLLSLPAAQAGPLVAGVAATYLDEAGYASVKHLRRKRLRLSSAQPLADVHSTPVQRLYNLMCLAYGSDPARYSAIASSGALPMERAESCEDEHRQAMRAWTKLLLPHVDREVAARIPALTLFGSR